MTNLDMLKTVKNGAELIRMYRYFNGGCIQHGKNAKEIWKTHCLVEPYRGEAGCRLCMEEFWNSEYKGDKSCQN